VTVDVCLHVCLFVCFLFLFYFLIQKVFKLFSAKPVFFFLGEMTLFSLYDFSKVKLKTISLNVVEFVLLENDNQLSVS